MSSISKICYSVESILFGVYSLETRLASVEPNKFKEIFEDVLKDLYEVDPYHMDLSHDGMEVYKQNRSVIFQGKTAKIIHERKGIFGKIQKVYLKLLEYYWDLKTRNHPNDLWMVFTLYCSRQVIETSEKEQLRVLYNKLVYSHDPRKECPEAIFRIYFSTMEELLTSIESGIKESRAEVTCERINGSATLYIKMLGGNCQISPTPNGYNLAKRHSLWPEKVQRISTTHEDYQYIHKFYQKQLNSIPPALIEVIDQADQKDQADRKEQVGIITACIGSSESVALSLEISNEVWHIELTKPDKKTERLVLKSERQNNPLHVTKEHPDYERVREFYYKQIIKTIIKHSTMSQMEKGEQAIQEWYIMESIMDGFILTVTDRSEKAIPLYIPRATPGYECLEKLYAPAKNRNSLSIRN